MDAAAKIDYKAISDMLTLRKQLQDKIFGYSALPSVLAHVEQALLAADATAHTEVEAAQKADVEARAKAAEAAAKAKAELDAAKAKLDTDAAAAKAKMDEEAATAPKA